jgi:hypothetical protein
VLRPGDTLIIMPDRIGNRIKPSRTQLVVASLVMLTMMAAMRLAIGKLLEHPSSMLPTLKSPKEAIDDLNARAKDMTRDATDSLSRLTKSSMATGRVACPVSANGAPDCKAASDKLCQSNGFKEGKSLAMDTTRNCSAKSLLMGGKPDESQCRTENFVTRALCQ